METCNHQIKGNIPDTLIEIPFTCMLRAGHKGHHWAKATMNGQEFEVEYDVEPKKP